MKPIFKVLTFSTIALTSAASNAEIIPTDFLIQGDKLLTLDDTTDRAWLDWSYTTNLTFDEISLRLRNPNDVLFGFEYASTYDVRRMASTLGLTMGSGLKSNSNGQRLLQNLGQTTSGTYRQTFGITDTKDSSDRSSVIALSTRSVDTYELRKDYGTNMRGGDSKANYGHALYKENWTASQTPNVPEPGTIALFGLALAGIASRKLFSA